MTQTAIAPFSYRADPDVPAFDDATPLIIFDGECGLCTGGVRWMMLRDKKRKIRFESIQQPVPQALYRHFGLDAEQFDTFMVLADGRAFLRWRGVCEAANLLPPPWRWLGRLGRLVPLFIGDRIYDWVQRNRFRWFGAAKEKPPVCPI